MPDTPHPPTQARIIVLETALQSAIQFIEDIRKARAGFWDDDGCIDVLAALDDALHPSLPVRPKSGVLSSLHNGERVP